MHARPSDQELIHRVLNGDTQAFSLLVTHYQNFVFTIALRYTNNREDAEEMAQSAFVKAYKSLKDYRMEAKFSTWLYTIVSSLCLTHLRKKKLNIHSLDQEHVGAAAGALDSGMYANTVEQKSKVELVNKAISQLKADDARILTLFYKGEQTLDEIGQILGIDPNTAKVKLHRARQRLKEYMEETYPEELKELHYTS